MKRVGANPPRNMFSISSATLTPADFDEDGSDEIPARGLGLSFWSQVVTSGNTWSLLAVGDGVSGESVITGGGGGGRGSGGATVEGVLIVVGAALEGSVPIGGEKEKGGKPGGGTGRGPAGTGGTTAGTMGEGGVRATGGAAGSGCGTGTYT